MVLPVGQERLTRNIEKVKVQGVYAGMPAPDFEATTLDGKLFKLSELRGKIVLLDFWATWCAPCLAQLPNIKKTYEDNYAAGLEVVSISFDRDADTARKFVADRGLSWTQIWTEKADKGPLADLYGVSAIPATFLVGSDGQVVAKDLYGDKLLQAVQNEIRRLRSVRPVEAPAESP